VAFVVTKERLARVELGPAAPIEAAVAGWLAAIGRNAADGDFPATLRTLAWDKVTRHVPAGIKTVYLTPDQALARVPWAALPGAKSGTVLLEDHALVTVPHGQSSSPNSPPRLPRRMRPAVYSSAAVSNMATTRPPRPPQVTRTTRRRLGPAVDRGVTCPAPPTKLAKSPRWPPPAD
jgi:hypothetical protein